MIVCPTAAISDDPGDSTPAINSLTPSATAAPISPANAPTQPGVRVVAGAPMVAVVVVMRLSCRFSMTVACQGLPFRPPCMPRAAAFGKCVAP